MKKTIDFLKIKCYNYYRKVKKRVLKKNKKIKKMLDF
jgi:hypothetical protein